MNFRCRKWKHLLYNNKIFCVKSEGQIKEIRCFALTARRRRQATISDWSFRLEVLMERTSSSFCVSQESNKDCGGRRAVDIMKKVMRKEAPLSPACGILLWSIHSDCTFSSAGDLSTSVNSSREPAVILERRI